MSKHEEHSSYIEAVNRYVNLMGRTVITDRQRGGRSLLMLQQPLKEELQVSARAIRQLPFLYLLGQYFECLSSLARWILLNDRTLSLHRLAQVLVVRDSASIVERAHPESAR